MESRTLKKKPLVEAILEIRWAPISSQPGMLVDPNYKILVGKLYDKVQEEYPAHEQLPTASVPDELTWQMVQHRFRKAQNDWPLLQVGPGIVTLNETKKYEWKEFRKRAIKTMESLINAYPQPAELKISSLLLRYIDSVEFDYQVKDVLSFLKKKMKVTFSLPKSLFKNEGVEEMAQLINYQSAFGCTRPKGKIIVKFATGQQDKTPSVVWETMVHSIDQEIPKMPEQFESWLDAAHTITHNWFFKLIEGELEKRFKDE